jgi:hypothetical protein
MILSINKLRVTTSCAIEIRGVQAISSDQNGDFVSYNNEQNDEQPPASEAG